MTTQPYLPNFIKAEAEAREQSIPVETREEYLTRMYWKFRNYKCNKAYDLEKKIKSVEQIRRFIERQR